MITIHDMPDHAKVWVYQANRPFSESENAFIEDQMNNFTGQWQAHGSDLAASFAIEQNQFIVLAVDETAQQATGCSIDASVHIIQHIEKETGLELLDRSQVAFLDGDRVNIAPFNKIKSAIKEGVIQPETVIYNNAVTNAGQWKREWKQTANQSWISRYF